MKLKTTQKPKNQCPQSLEAVKPYHPRINTQVTLPTN
jgi:hypothetical protein